MKIKNKTMQRFFKTKHIKILNIYCDLKYNYVSNNFKYVTYYFNAKYNCNCSLI